MDSFRTTLRSATIFVAESILAAVFSLISLARFLMSSARLAPFPAFSRISVAEARTVCAFVVIWSTVAATSCMVAANSSIEADTEFAFSFELLTPFCMVSAELIIERDSDWIFFMMLCNSVINTLIPLTSCPTSSLLRTFILCVRSPLLLLISVVIFFNCLLAFFAG